MSLDRLAPVAPASVPAVLAAALAGVADQHEAARTERRLALGESAVRQAALARGAACLERAATRQVAGAALSGAFQIVASACAFGAAAASGPAPVLTAQSQLNQALAKSGDAVAATAGFAQAEKTRLDRAAEAAQLAAQESARARAADLDAAHRARGDAREVVRLLRDAAQAARGA
jgi:hypothetical protein